MVFFTLLPGALGIGQMTCVSYQSSANSFSILNDKKAAPILISASSITNLSSPLNSGFAKTSAPIIVGTLGRSSLIQQVINSTGLDVSVIQGNWESFMPLVVYNPLLGIATVQMLPSEPIREVLSFLFMTILNSLVSKLCSYYAHLLRSTVD